MVDRLDLDGIAEGGALPLKYNSPVNHYQLFSSRLLYSNKTLNDSYIMSKYSPDHLQPNKSEYYVESIDSSAPNLYCICQKPYNDERYILKKSK